MQILLHRKPYDVSVIESYKMTIRICISRMHRRVAEKQLNNLVLSTSSKLKHRINSCMNCMSSITVSVENIC